MQGQEFFKQNSNNTRNNTETQQMESYQTKNFYTANETTNRVPVVNNTA